MLVLNLDQTTGVLYLDDVIFKYNAEADYLKVKDLLVNKLKDKLLYINGFHKYGAFDVIAYSPQYLPPIRKFTLPVIRIDLYHLMCVKTF